jgi:hypothetical protein
MTRILCAVLACLFAAPAYSAVVGEWRVVLLRGSTTQATITASTQEVAWAECQARIAAQPAGTTTWTCQTPRYVARVVAEPSVCTIPQPAAETRPGECPTGTTGSWTQSRAYVSALYPTCWTAGPWTPSDTPVGACTAPPPPAGQWLKCADQSGTCQLTGTNRVRFGRDTRWIEKTLTGNVTCNSTVFEGNPTPNEQKTCEVWSTGPAAPPDPDPVPVARTIRWQPPTTNTDGSPLTDLAGFRVNCTSPRGIGLRWTVPSPATLSERIDTAVGSICMVTALNSAGTESPPSASVTIR